MWTWYVIVKKPKWIFCTHIAFAVLYDGRCILNAQKLTILEVWELITESALCIDFGFELHWLLPARGPCWLYQKWSIDCWLLHLILPWLDLHNALWTMRRCEYCGVVWKLFNVVVFYRGVNIVGYGNCSVCCVLWRREYYGMIRKLFNVLCIMEVWKWNWSVLCLMKVWILWYEKEIILCAVFYGDVNIMVW